MGISATSPCLHHSFNKVQSSVPQGRRPLSSHALGAGLGGALGNVTPLPIFWETWGNMFLVWGAHFPKVAGHAAGHPPTAPKEECTYL